jgi:nucleotide-binding universal stress UspA family protein
MGHPADEILETAQEKNADIILIGSAGKRVSHLFMGSVSREVVNRAEIPVLVVR